jgi:hypothetical protein
VTALTIMMSLVALLLVGKLWVAAAIVRHGRSKWWRRARKMHFLDKPAATIQWFGTVATQPGTRERHVSESACRLAR